MLDSSTIFQLLIIVLFLVVTSVTVKIVYHLLKIKLFRSFSKKSPGGSVKPLVLWGLFIVVISVITYYLYMEYNTRKAEYTILAKKEAKKAYIKPTIWCLEETYRQSYEKGFLEEQLYIPAFYKECLKMSEYSADFCESIEPIFSYTSERSFFSGKCRELNIGEQECGSYHSQTLAYCYE